MVSSSKPGYPKVMSSYHQGRHVALVLSVVSSNHVMTASVLSGEKWFMKQHASSDIPEDSCICRLHCREAK